MDKCLLEFLKYDKNRSIYLLRKSYKEEKCPQVDSLMDDKIYSSRERDGLCHCRDKSSESVKYKPEFANIILYIVCFGEPRVEYSYLVFLSWENTYDFQIGESINDAIKEAIPILVGCTLVLIGGIAELVYSPYGKRE